MATEQTLTTLNKPCFLLIVIAGMERFAFKGVAANLVTYLTDVAKMSNSRAAKTVNSWCGFTSILPLLVAPLVDSCWDRYSTILVSSSLYVLGLLALTSTTLEWPWIPVSKTKSLSSLFWSLYIISLGQGGFNPSLQAFGADQLDHDDELPCTKNNKNPGKRTLFFQWWYFGICTGSLFGVLIMSYIQDTIGWGLGFAIPAIAMATSTALFFCGSRFYTYKQAMVVHTMSFDNIIQTIKATTSRLINGKITLSEVNKDVAELELEEKPLCDQHLECNKDLDEKPYNGVHLLETAKVVLNLLPIWTMMLMFAVIFQQPPTFFTKQGTTMKRNIGSSKFKIPPATLQSTITVSIILLMPLYDKLLIPLTQFFTGNIKCITVKQRIGIGMFLSVIAMVIAAIVETKRLETIRKVGISETGTVPFSILWLLPQYILLGISDIFTVVGMQEFFCSEFPAKMRTMGLALCTSVFGVGSFLSGLLISLIEHLTSSRGSKLGWFSDDMSKSQLHKYYWLLALLSALSLLMFVILCTFHKSRNT